MNGKKTDFSMFFIIFISLSLGFAGGYVSRAISQNKAENDNLSSDIIEIEVGNLEIVEQRNDDRLDKIGEMVGGLQERSRRGALEIEEIIKLANQVLELANEKAEKQTPDD